MTSGGIARMNAVTAAAVTYVPVGLFGLQMNASRVFGVTALAMAGRSWRWSFNGTRTGFAGTAGTSIFLTTKMGAGLIPPSPPSRKGLGHNNDTSFHPLSRECL